MIFIMADDDNELHRKKPKGTISAKYHATEAGEFEPDSHGLVLKNLLGLKTQAAIDAAEVSRLLRLPKQLSVLFFPFSEVTPINLFMDFLKSNSVLYIR